MTKSFPHESMVTMKTRLGSQELEALAVGAFFVALAYWFLEANMFAGQIVAPMDLLLQFAGWKESGLSLPLFNRERSDILDAWLPKWIFVRNSFLSGKLPMWNPLPAGGEPVLWAGSPQLSVGFLIFLIFGSGIGFSVALWARLVIAGLGAYVLCRRRFGVLPALFGGITYMMAGFNVSWLMWPQVETSMWVPWVVWSIIRLERKPTSARLATLSAFVAALIFGGFPAVAGYTLYAGGLLVLWLLASRITKGESLIGCLKRTGTVFLGVAAGCLLASVELLPTFQFLSQFDFSWRRGGSSAVGRGMLLLNPFRYGLPRVESTGYVGILAVVLSIVALAYALRLKRVREPLSPFFWLILASLTFLLVYGAPWPQLAHQVRQLYRLPVLNNNPSQRILVILDLSFAVLGASGLYAISLALSAIFRRYRLSIPRGRALKAIILLALVAIQVADISRVGQAENAVVPANTFFPSTPSIRYVQEHILPGQSIIQTADAFMDPGTLTAYGLSDWFAHTYHTNQEKAILSQIVKNPWSTPTAANFRINQINLNSNLIDALAIRYVLTTKSSLKDYQLLPPADGQTGKQQFSPPMPQNAIGETIHLSESRQIVAMEFLARASGQTSGSLVYLVAKDASGHKLAQASARTDEIGAENTWILFKFDQILKLEPGNYEFQVNMNHSSTGFVSLWRTTMDAFKGGSMTLNGKAVDGDLAFHLISFPSAEMKGWTALMVGDQIVILERLKSPPGAYLLSENASWTNPNPRAWSWDNLTLEHYDPNSAVFRVTTDQSGWLVRAARVYPGWVAVVNGKPAETRRYLGILPAVHVGVGSSVVEWRYEPFLLMSGAAISAATLLILLLLLTLPMLSRRTTARSRVRLLKLLSKKAKTP
jgi:hypothetical protein